MKLLSVVVLFLSLVLSVNAEVVRVSDDIVKDTKTNYLWQDTKDVSSKKMSFNEAMAYCKKLELDGEKSWQVPGFMELLSIVNPKLYNPAISKNFNFVTPDKYWTSKIYGDKGNEHAFVVNFTSGAYNRERSDYKFHVRCYKKAN